MKQTRSKFPVLVGAFVMSLGVLASPGQVFAHAMSDNWYNNDTVGSGYVTSGGYVMAIQRMLKETPWGYSSVDGYFGTNTKNGIIGFQRGEAIAADGVAGPVTWGEFQDYRVYVGTNGGTGQYYNFTYDISGSYPARYYRDACYGWYIDRSTSNTGDYWQVDHDFEKRSTICL